MIVKALRIHVRGVVQGVGFRPFVYQLALKNGLHGRVFNTSGDVTIEIEGTEKDIQNFLNELQTNHPPQSRLESISEEKIEPSGYNSFEILHSLVKENEYQLISPDLATCSTCQKEIFDPDDRRFRYPFTNCTNCGPRFTIIEDIPYDRPRTTMKDFSMCPECRREYNAPSNRRFHAQPNACPVCGPRLELVSASGRAVNDTDPVPVTARLLAEGRIIAIKGLGGFLLACDASNHETVQLLRHRKQRPSKPLAVMLKDMAEVRRYCSVNDLEAEALQSSACPIVLLRMKENIGLSPAVAPGLKHLGVMLPYTPLHHLLLEQSGLPLVMTSGNLSEEPIARDNMEALQRLHDIADYFLMHNRKIFSSYDDSVVSIDLGEVRVLRRARGYAPFPVRLPFLSQQVLACGPELKNTFCLVRDDYAFVSQHIGDLENDETLEHFENTLRLYEKLFRIQPRIISCDLHPDYLSTKWAEVEAEKKHLPLVRVQHHHAHIVSCMAENGVQKPVIGIALDGTGYGSDGKIWGSEFMIADYSHFERKAHLEYLPLPGGSAAIRKPSRTAAGYLYALFGAEILKTDLPFRTCLDEYELELIKKQIDQGLNSPLTSSCGRLFDAVSSLLGIRHQVDYEGQAAIELEVAADGVETADLYPFRIDLLEGIRIIRVKELFEAVLSDLNCGIPVSLISARFHNTLTECTLRICHEISEESGIKQVALSGGVFQNRRLLKNIAEGLKKTGLLPLLHRQVPFNDGCISLGQAVVADSRKNW